MPETQNTTPSTDEQAGGALPEVIAENQMAAESTVEPAETLSSGDAQSPEDELA